MTDLFDQIRKVMSAAVSANVFISLPDVSANVHEERPFG
jgi:hypothetical protein